MIDGHPELLTSAIVQAIKAHAIAEFPNESCGLITADGYVRCTNVDPKPRDNFAISDEEQAKHAYIAVVHSHPNGPDAPTESDMRGQMSSAVPWVIVTTDGKNCLQPFAWGDQLPILPMIARPFRHGVLDCGSLIRDTYRLGKDGMANPANIGGDDPAPIKWPFPPILIPDFPRSDLWWNDKRNIYVESFERAGFTRIDGPEDGCVFLAQILSPVPNHGGVYLGGGLALHHLQNRLSRREPIHQWSRKYVTHWLRYTGPGK